MRNSRLLPYETIVQAASGEPEAVNTILQHYRRHIYFSAFVNGQFNPDAEDYITQTLLAAIFKFRFRECRHSPQLNTPPSPAAAKSSKSEKDLLLFSLSVWQNRNPSVVGR